MLLVRLDHVASAIVNANHCIMCAAGVLGISDCIRDGVRFAIPQPTERQRIGDEIDAAMIFAWADFVNVRRTHFFLPRNKWPFRIQISIASL